VYLFPLGVDPEKEARRGGNLAVAGPQSFRGHRPGKLTLETINHTKLNCALLQFGLSIVMWFGRYLGHSVRDSFDVPPGDQFIDCRWPGIGLVAFRSSQCPKFPFPDQMSRAPDRSIGSEVDIYHNKQCMIAIVAVWLNVILGRHYLFAPQIEPSLLIFRESMPYFSKSILF
jgi:hypothetical protein